MQFRILLFVAIALGLAQASFADTVTASAGSSSCTNSAGSPTPVDYGPPYGIVLYTAFSCSLYDDASSYTFDLTPLLTQGGANAYDNYVVPGYTVVINGDPNTISAGDTDDAALYNESLWDTVLYWPGDQDAGYASDSLTVFEPGDFPSALAVQTFDDSIYDYYYGPGNYEESDFFVEATGSETVYAPGPNEYDVYAAPESGTMPLLGTGLAMLGLVVLKKRRGAPQAA